MRPKTTKNEIDEEIARVAARQRDLVTRAQLLAAGLGDRGIRHRVAARKLRVVHRGVYVVGHQALSRTAAWLAAVLACGPDAALSHRPAGALWRLISEMGGEIDVTIPTWDGKKARNGIKVHRQQLHETDVLRLDGIRVTSAALTLIDLAAVLPRRQVERAFDEAEYLGRFSPTALEDTLARYPKRKGSRAARRLLAEHTAGSTRTRSELEERFLALCAEHGLPRPQVNVEIAGFLVDFLWREAGLVVETDGYAAHSKRSSFEKDRARTVALQAAGLIVLRFTYRQVFGRGDWVMTHVSSALGNRTR